MRRHIFIATVAVFAACVSLMGQDGENLEPAPGKTEVVKDLVKGSEKKRGMWRGEFVDPDDWRAGKRLPGEQ